MVAGGPERPLRPGSTNHRHKQQLLPQRQCNCFCTQPPPQPVVMGPYMPNFELFYYLITSYITLLLFTIHYRHPLTPPALCRYARTP